MVLSSILQPSISIFVTPIPPLHPQTTQAFHPTWSSPILPAPISASDPAVSDPSFSLFPGLHLQTHHPSPQPFPSRFTSDLLLLEDLPARAEAGGDCQSGTGSWGWGLPPVPAHPLGCQLPACARLGHQCDGGIYGPSHRPQLSQSRKSLPSPGGRGEGL